MARNFSRISASLAVIAAFTMVASPAMARGWGGSHWGGHRHHRGNGIDGGDVLAGLLILGGIAAIASAADKADKRQNDSDAPYPEPDDRASAPRYGDAPERDYQPGNGGIDAAVDTCVQEVERADRRISSVDTVQRDGEGWRVEGQVGNGRDFACSVGGNGRIRSVTVDGRAAY